MPFPFNLAGPDFLLFYIVGAAALLAVAVLAVQASERAAGGPQALPTDPYEIAFLRDGAAEAIKIAVLSLIDRGLISHETDKSGAAVLQPAPDLRTKPRHPVEALVMSRVTGPTDPESLAGPGLAHAATQLIVPALAARGLVLAGPVWARRVTLLGGAWALLTLLFAARMAQALANQRSNVWLLVILWIGMSVAAVAIARKLPHAGAMRALEALRSLLAGLGDRLARARRGRATNELALLAATFGFWAVPETMAPYAHDLSLALTPRPPPRGDSGSGSGCGSGGGSSSCGGGGGGGCGGCGGG